MYILNSALLLLLCIVTVTEVYLCIYPVGIFHCFQHSVLPSGVIVFCLKKSLYYSFSMALLVINSLTFVYLMKRLSFTNEGYLHWVEKSRLVVFFQQFKDVIVLVFGFHLFKCEITD